MQYSAVQCNTVQYSAVQCSFMFSADCVISFAEPGGDTGSFIEAVQSSGVKSGVVHCSVVHCSAV